MLLRFSFRKTTQALNFFAVQSGGQINKMKALKLLYFADRFHLRKFGRPITNDEYFAMNYGPVPSGAKDLAEGSDFRPDAEKEYAGQFLNPTQRREFSSVQAPDPSVFSKTDKEALEFAWKNFGSLTEFALAELTHRYPEWKKHEASLQGGLNSRVKMSYTDFLEDPSDTSDRCHPLTEEERQLRREEIEELREMHALWS